MAKKSAATKGYRKFQKKKPFLTKKEIIELIIIVVAIIAAIVLFNIFYDDGLITAKQVSDGDILAYGTSEVHTRYKKLGTINELEGYTLAPSSNNSTALVTYTFTPDDPESNVLTVTVGGSVVEASSLANTTLSYFSGEGLSSHYSELLTTEIQGHETYVFGYTGSYYDESQAPAADSAEEAPAEETPAEEAPAAEEPAEETPAEETPAAEEPAEEAPAEETPAEEEPVEETPADNVFTQNLTCYVKYDDTHTLAMHIYMQGSDESFFVADEDLIDFITPFTDSFTLAENAK